MCTDQRFYGMDNLLDVLTFRIYIIRWVYCKIYVNAMYVGLFTSESVPYQLFYEMDYLLQDRLTFRTCMTCLLRDICKCDVCKPCRTAFCIICIPCFNKWLL